MYKTAVITGASSGMGEAVADHLLSKGWNVIMISRSVDKMDNIAKKYSSHKSIVIGCDLIKCELIDTLIIPKIEKYLKINNIKGIDFLFNNAGMSDGTRDNDLALTQRQWDNQMNLLAKTPYFLAKSLEPYFNKYASIINNGSMAGNRLAPVIAMYSIGKRTLRAVTESLAMYLGNTDKRIRVNTMETSVIPTPIHERSMGKKGAQEWMEKCANKTPLGTNGTIKDVIGMIEWLIDNNASRHISGQHIGLDGAFCLSLFTNDFKMRKAANFNMSKL